MTHLKKHKIILLNQYGRRTHRTRFFLRGGTQNLLMDNAHQNTFQLFIVSNDFEGCYDRIIAVFASTLCFCYGILLEPLFVLTTLLHNQQHYIRTGHILSTVPSHSILNNILDRRRQNSGHSGSH